jgi:hypothetical protein
MYFLHNPDDPRTAIVFRTTRWSDMIFTPMNRPGGLSHIATLNTERMAANTVPAGINIGELTEHRGVRECLQWFTREKQWINEIHLELCRIPAPTFLEQQRAEWMADRFRSLGWEAKIDRAGNVYTTGSFIGTVDFDPGDGVRCRETGQERRPIRQRHSPYFAPRKPQRNSASEQTPSQTDRPAVCRNPSAHYWRQLKSPVARESLQQFRQCVA